MVEVRDFRAEDADEVSRLARVAWNHTYGAIYSEAHIAEFVDRFYSSAALQMTVPAVQRGDAQFQVAIDSAGKLVGFCHVGRDASKDLELYRIYLHPDCIGQGVGSLLLTQAESFIVRSSADRYHCYVHRLNELGKNFYQRRKFVRVPAHDAGDEWYLQKILP